MVGQDRKIPFYITISYLLGFLGIRLLVILAGSAESEFATAAKMGEMPEIDFYIGTNIILFGYHIHHFYFGIALIAIAGWLAIVGSDWLSKKQIAILYGSGLGLFMDEIGLLLSWGDYYSSTTYLLSLLVVGIFLNIVLFPFFWQEVKKNVIIQSKTHLVFRILNNKTIFKVVDTMSEKTGRTEKTSLFFTGTIFVIVGVLTLFYPTLVSYWVAGGFIIQGVSSLIRAWQK